MMNSKIFKRNSFLFIIIFLFQSFLFAQGGWIVQNLNTTAHLISINFPSLNTGYIVGWSSKIFRTTDGGNNWSQLSHNLSIDFQSIYFVNNNYGWAVGGAGKMASTTNGGLNWVSMNSGTSRILYQVVFRNALTGWVVSENGLLLKTTNGGTNWFTVASGTGYNLAGIGFTDSITGWIIGNNGVVMKTTNNGDNWFSVGPGVTNNFSKLFFVNSLTGWVTGENGIIVKTTNGGSSWVLQSSGLSNWMIQPFFVSANTGWVSGSSGLILKTTNGGENWIKQNKDTVNALHGVYFISEKTGWACGFNGALFKTTNGGVIYTISGYAKYNDNNLPVTSGMVKAIKLNKNTGELTVIDSSQILSDGSYSLAHVTQDTVDIGIYPNSTTQTDYVVTHYPSATYWERASVIYPTGNMSNVNIMATRSTPYTANNSVNGKVTKILNSTVSGLKDAVLYAKFGNAFVRCGITDGNGVYHIQSLPTGNIKIIVNRIGFSSDSINVNVNSISIIDSVNFLLRNVYVGIKKTGEIVSTGYSLLQNYPNPFNPVTTIRYQVADKKPNIRLEIYNIQGKKITTLVNGKQSRGIYEVTFDASGLPSGVYIYKLICRGQVAFEETRKMVLIK